MSSSLIIPPRAPNGLDEILAFYGDPKIARSSDGNWTVDPAWESSNCITINHEIIPAAQRHKLYVHRHIADPLLALFDDWLFLQQTDGYVVESIGCFNKRAKAASSGLVPSTHCWAIAFDLNPNRNRLIICPAGDPRRTAPGAKNIPDWWIAAAKRRGFFWGGDFSGRFDPMHFQLCRGY